MVHSGHPARLQKPLVDNHGRRITYLRLAITDRCNLRCRYCRTEDGVPFIPHNEILSFEEHERLATIFSMLGVDKIRVTGGEPFSRRGCISFMARLREMDGIHSLHITTNGVKTARFLDALKDMKIDGLNLSLDTLDPARFLKITRRDYLDSVPQTFHGAVRRGIPLKMNSVVLEDTSDQEIIQLAELAQQYPVTTEQRPSGRSRAPYPDPLNPGSIANYSRSDRSLPAAARKTAHGLRINKAYSRNLFV